MYRLVPLVLVLGCGSSDPVRNAAPAPAPTPAPTEAAQAGNGAPEVTGAGTVLEASFASDALGVEKRYFVYLPGGYDTSEARYPVVYMLHGLGGSEDDWTKHGGLTAAADELALPVIAVMPDGDDSFYSNWVGDVDYESCLQGKRPFGRAKDMKTYCVKRARYEDYIVDDLVAHIDATYRTIPERRARAIGGLSMGGFGALTLAMRHKDVYASTASHAGVATLLYKGPFPYVKGNVELTDDPKQWLATAGAFGVLFEKVFGEDVVNWRAHDPAHMARSLEDGELAIYLDCGTEDEFRLQNGAAYLHEVLEERNIDHFFALMPGHHNSEFWSNRIDDSLRFHTEQFVKLGVWNRSPIAAVGATP